ncbi:DUF2750 domain-containing protein [Ruficoccus sp. ZRK36]|uniref:DUF2750 domain-containing protein n=1 Tax=Ruficoccus sp. ZRK36 TaxID=2866311 RepID=UPI001C73ABA6|nr:DUF2750 domain-containing protein [Ruficoccus sp. ZRK36]QYY36750.1 DUF2750 domain-containing protein [Ruficoccus sp. ZRK36]
MKPRINEKQLRSVMGLSAPKRYSYFIKKVADWEMVWGLYQNGWALTQSSEGNTVFPFWPAMEFAQLCATNEWENYSPEEIPLSDFMNDLLPKLGSDGILPGVFFVPEHGSVNASANQILEDLNEELSRLE